MAKSTSEIMIVVESGSTKADWMVLTDAGQTQYSTKGFNPRFHSEQFIVEELSNHKELGAIRKEVDKIYFYGAGCSDDKLNSIVSAGLGSFFLNAVIQVDHDLNASAFACYNGVPEIACILGTGSNSCSFDGKTVREETPSLGYILGDEGSGSYFGKRILADFLYCRLPEQIQVECKAMGLDKEIVLEKVYSKPDPNVFIASMASVLIHNKDLSYSQKLIKNGFQEFLDLHVKCFSDYQEYEVNFVGSIASLLQDELQFVCSENGIKVGRILRRPLQNLVNYHLNFSPD